MTTDDKTQERTEREPVQDLGPLRNVTPKFDEIINKYCQPGGKYEKARPTVAFVLNLSEAAASQNGTNVWDYEPTPELHSYDLQSYGQLLGELKPEEKQKFRTVLRSYVTLNTDEQCEHRDVKDITTLVKEYPNQWKLIEKGLDSQNTESEWHKETVQKVTSFVEANPQLAAKYLTTNRKLKQTGDTFDIVKDIRTIRNPKVDPRLIDASEAKADSAPVRRRHQAIEDKTYRI